MWALKGDFTEVHDSGVAKKKPCFAGKVPPRGRTERTEGEGCPSESGTGPWTRLLGPQPKRKRGTPPHLHTGVALPVGPPL